MTRILKSLDISTPELKNRALMAENLRNMVDAGAAEITIIISAKTALNLADDIEYAVLNR